MPAAHAGALRTGARPPRARRDRSRIGFARPSRWKGWRRGAESAHPVCSVIAERGIRLELHGALVRAGRGVAALDRVASTDLRAAHRLQARPCAAGEAAKIETACPARAAGRDRRQRAKPPFAGRLILDEAAKPLAAAGWPAVERRLGLDLAEAL